MNRDTYNKPSRLVPVFLVAALTGCLIPTAPASLINPDPGGAQVTAFALGQVPPAGSSYHPLVKLPGTDTYELIPDRTGMITLSAQITHDFNGTITSAIKADLTIRPRF